MKKVHFLVTCCLVVGLALGGCAKEEPPLEAPVEADASPEMPVEPEDVENVEETEEDTVDLEAFLAKLETMSDDELDALFADESLTDDEFNALVEVMDARAAAREANKEPHGIIALTSQFDMNSGINYYTVYKIDPETGKSVEIRSFATSVNPVSGTNYVIEGGVSWSYPGCKRHWFFDDYTRLVATKTFRDTQDVHAGWIDEDGNFFDVSEAIGDIRSNDFEDPTYCKGEGFTHDGKFVYSCGRHGYGYFCEITGSSGSYSCSTPAEGEVSMPTFAYEWLDDTHYIGYKDSPCILDVTKPSLEDVKELLPHSTERNSWSAVISPDREYVAFLSQLKQGNLDGKSDLFIMSLSDPSNIAKLETDLTFLGGAAGSSLLEWHK